MREGGARDHWCQTAKLAVRPWRLPAYDRAYRAKNSASMFESELAHRSFRIVVRMSWLIMFDGLLYVMNKTVGESPVTGAILQISIAAGGLAAAYRYTRGVSELVWARNAALQQPALPESPPAPEPPPTQSQPEG